MSEYIKAPGAELEVGPKGKLYETLGTTEEPVKGGAPVAILGIGLLIWWLVRKPKRA